MGDLIDGCIVVGGCSIDYNGPGCNLDLDLNSVSLLNDKRHIATHSNNIFFPYNNFFLCINFQFHGLQCTERLAKHILICSRWLYNIFFFREEIANYYSQKAVLGFQNSFFSWVFRVIYS